MSLSNSQIFIINDTESVQTINTLSVNPGQQLLIWNTKESNNEDANARYLQIKDHFETVRLLVASGDVRIVQDGITMVEEQIVPLFTKMHGVYFFSSTINNQLPKIKTDSLKEKDGRLNVTPTPVGFGWLTWFTGAGDDPVPISTSGRGEGQKMIVQIEDGYDHSEVKISFAEPIHIHDGQIYWGDDGAFTVDDTFSVGVDIYATKAEAVDGYGNANKVDTGLGFSLFVPAAGNGYWNIDLETDADVSPIPVYGMNPNGFWDITEETGIIRPADAPGAGSFNLADAPMPRAYFMKNMPMAHPLRVFDMDVYKTEYIHQNWDVVLEVDKPSSGAGWVAGWMLTFRRNNT